MACNDEALAIEPQPKRAKTSEADATSRFLRSWAWKREHRPDRDRFQRPYVHELRLPGEQQALKLTIHQARFREQGFASTVWDSSIVLAKYFERWPECCRGMRACDLSAGCGLVGIALAKLGAAAVTATDLAPNLQLLGKNCTANGVEVTLAEHWWGTDTTELGKFGVIAACDVMYVEDAIQPLVQSLRDLSTPDTSVYVAHGRNRFAEASFMKAIQGVFSCTEVAPDELDDVYQCSDVSVYRLKLVERD